MRAFFGRLYYWRAFLQFRAYGSGVQLGLGGVFLRPQEVSLGDHVSIARGFWISARSLSIGSHVMAGPNLVIECDDHVTDQVGISMNENGHTRRVSPVTIEDDVWIGANVIILRGVTVREGSVIGAGSVVTKSSPPYSICFGNPCRPRRTRFTAEQIGEHMTKVGSKYSVDVVLRMWHEAGLNNA